MVPSRIDAFVKSQEFAFSVIPAKAGIQSFQLVTECLDSGFHRSDVFKRFSTFYEIIKVLNVAKKLHEKINGLKLVVGTSFLEAEREASEAPECSHCKGGVL